VEKLSGKKAITQRPADLLEPGMEKVRKQCVDKGLPSDDETAVLFAMFPQQVEALLKPKAAAAPEPKPAAAPAPAIVPAANGGATKLYVTLGGNRHEVFVETLAS
jgi:pyruvate/oxaloacetate carboxyltransferase